ADLVPALGRVEQLTVPVVAEATGGRMTLGIGVSSPAIVSKVRGIEYGKPYSFMKTYLEAMEGSLYTSVAPADPVPVVLAALGPKMLELAAEKTAGAHPYNTTPEHTAMAREVMGPDAGLYVEQKVLLTTDAEQARATGASVLKFYSRAPGYVNAWKRMGFTDDDISTQSERLVDALVAWGTAEQIEARLQEHADAGATHICIHPLDPVTGQGVPDAAALEAFAPS
ncbi:MAG: TIGR03620 family F420-dependent LLM class oxidoreductase, partial [Actinomycetota bacterium]